MVTSRIALEGLLQNRLTTDICKDTLRMQESAVDLFHLYAGKHHADDTSSSSCCAEMMTTATIKREAHTPTTDQSEDSGVDVSATAATNSTDGRGRPYKRKRLDDDSDDGDGDECPSAAKSSRTATAAAAVLSVNVAACPPFRPWSSDESSSDVGLRLFHDIRNVDRILTLTQRRREPPPEPQPLDLTKGRERRSACATGAPAEDVAAQAAERAAAERAAAAQAAEKVTAAQATAQAAERVAAQAVERVAAQTAERVDAQAHPTTTTEPRIASPARTTCGTGTTRYSKNMSRARRIEANARERSRVHTISAAFDTLRSAIPSYSRNQKLSKLSTIRIASAYILTLSRLLDMDYSAGQDAPSVDECVDNVTGIIHMEGKARKRRDEQ